MSGGFLVVVWQLPRMSKYVTDKRMSLMLVRRSYSDTLTRKVIELYQECINLDVNDFDDALRMTRVHTLVT